MKIISVDTTLLRLPEVLPVGDNCQTVAIVTVHTDEGISGIGEVHTNPLVTKAIIDAPVGSTNSVGLREVLVGEDPAEIGRLWDLMYARTSAYGRRGAAIHAISGIDMALWDIAGKAAGLPVHMLLGGPRREAVKAYASFLAPADPREAIELVGRHSAAGFSAVKLGWGGLGDDVRSDVAMVGAVREAIGPRVDLMLDMGEPVSLREAIYLGEALSEHNLYFLEEPLASDDVRGYRTLIARSPTVIATGEKETTLYPFMDLIESGLQVIQPDVARVGGITETVRIARYAEALGVTVIPHCWATDVLVAATLQVLATLKDSPFLEFNVSENPLRQDLATQPFKQEGGSVRIPTGPGLGVELDPDVIATYRWDP